MSNYAHNGLNEIQQNLFLWQSKKVTPPTPQKKSQAGFQMLAMSP